MSKQPVKAFKKPSGTNNNKSKAAMPQKQSSIVVTDLDASSMMEAPEDDDYGPTPTVVGVTQLPDPFSTSMTSLPEAYNSDSSDEDEDRQEELNLETQRILMRTFDEFYKQESETMLNILAMSRDGIKDTVVDLIEEQAEFKNELSRVSEGKYNNARKKGEKLRN